jgi:hypothetical protein
MRSKLFRVVAQVLAVAALSAVGASSAGAATAGARPGLPRLAPICLHGLDSSGECAPSPPVALSAE